MRKYMSYSDLGKGSSLRGILWYLAREVLERWRAFEKTIREVRLALYLETEYRTVLNRPLNLAT